MSENNENVISKQNEILDNQPIDGDFNDETATEQSVSDEIYEFKKTLEELNAELIDENNSQSENQEQTEEVFSEVKTQTDDFIETSTKVDEDELKDLVLDNFDGEDVFDVKVADENNDDIVSERTSDLADTEKSAETDEKNIETDEKNIDDTKLEQAAQSAQKSSESDDLYKKEFNDYKYLKTAKRLDCDLTDVNFTAKILKDELKKMPELGFNSATVLQSKVPFLRQEIKSGINVCVAIDYPMGESSTRAKIVDMRKAKFAGVKAFEVSFGVSLLKEGKKRNVLRELASLRRVAGKKCELKIAIDVLKLTDDELKTALKLIASKKADVVLLRNSQTLTSHQKLTAAKSLNGNCKLQLTDLVKNGADINRLSEIGAERILLTNYDEVSENLKNELK